MCSSIHFNKLNATSSQAAQIAHLTHEFQQGIRVRIPSQIKFKARFPSSTIATVLSSQSAHKNLKFLAHNTLEILEISANNKWTKCRKKNSATTVKYFAQKSMPT